MKKSMKKSNKCISIGNNSNSSNNIGSDRIKIEINTKSRSIKRINMNSKKNKNDSGVSLITLVITVIVVIILAAIGLNGGGNTVSQASFSKFASEVSSIQEAMVKQETMQTGKEVVKGMTVTEAQVFNFLARGGVGEYLSVWEAEQIDCTKLEKNKMETAIGMKLPKIKVSVPNSMGVEVDYYVTKEGEVFIWPPFIYENELWVNGRTKLSNVTVKSPGTTYNSGITFKVGEVEISTSNATGEGIEIVYNGDGNVWDVETPVASCTHEWGDGVDIVEATAVAPGKRIYTCAKCGETRTEETPMLSTEAIYAKLKIGDYVRYNSAAGESVTWRVFNKKNGKIIIIPMYGIDTEISLGGLTGYKKVAIDKLEAECDAYVSGEIGVTASDVRSMTLEDILEVAKVSEPVLTNRYAFYGNWVGDEKIVNVTGADGKTYVGVKHSACLIGWPRFYEYTESANTAKDEYGMTYAYPVGDAPVLVTETYYFDTTLLTAKHKNDTNITVGSLLSTRECWLASTCATRSGDSMDYMIRRINNARVGGLCVVESDGGAEIYACRIRPIISLNGTLEIADGKGTVIAPWKLKSK